MSRFLVSAMWIAAFLGIGLFSGPYLRAGYERMFPPPDYVSGDYADYYGRAGKPVVMFSTSTCPYCKRARAWLQQQGVDYRDYVIDESADAHQLFDRLGGGGVPQVLVGHRRVLGFRENILRESLATAAR